MSATPARTPLGRAARKRSVRIIAAGAAIGVATTAIVSAGGPAAGAATPLAQSVGRFVDGTAGGNPIQSLVDVADARAKAAPDAEQRNPLDVTALNAIKLPLTGALQLPGGGVFTLGAVNQVAVAKTTGASYGASGAVSNSGGVSVGGSSAFPADANIQLSSAALGSVAVPGLPTIQGVPGLPAAPSATALGGVQAQIGAVSALAQTAAGGAFASPRYQVAGLKLVLDSPALGQLLQTIATGGQQLNALLGALPSALSVGALPSACSLNPITAASTTLSLDGGAVVLDAANAKLTVDLGKLLQVLGLNINNLPPNTDLLAYLLNNLGSILSTGLGDLISGITTPLQALGTACIPALGPLAGIVSQVLTALTNGQSQLQTAITSVSTSLANAGAPGLKTLTDQLSNVLAIGVNVQQGAFPLAGAAKPKYVFTSKLAATPDQSTPVVSGQGVVRAIEIDLLGGQAASLALASAAAGPSSAVVAPTTSAPAPSTTAPNTQIPTGVPAGAAGHGDTTPALPLVLLLLGLVLAGGGATFYRTRGKFGR